MAKGMLWLPNWGKGKKRMQFAEAVQQAVRYYKDKYGVWPTVCRVRPDEAGGCWNTDLLVIRDETVTPSHLLLTEEEIR